MGTRLEVLHYPCGENVELFDQVEFDHDGIRFEGEVKKIMPRKRELVIQFEDNMSINKSGNCSGRIRSFKVAIADVDFMARSM